MPTSKLTILLVITASLLLASMLSACGDVIPTAQGAALLPTLEAQPTSTSTIIPTRTSTPLPSATATTIPPTRTPTLAPGMRAVTAGRVSVPVLMYHNISSQGSTAYITRVGDFRAQMKYLHDNGYQTISVTQVANAIREGGVLPEKAVVLTFDDGYEGVYENAFPITQEYGFTGTVYIITSTLEKNKSYGYMKPEQYQELAEAGWEIGSHTINHANLKTIATGFVDEVKGSKETLEEVLGIEVRTFSYPFAASNDWIAREVKKYGYESAVGVGTLNTHTQKGLYFLSRREVPRGISLKEFQALLAISP